MPISLEAISNFRKNLRSRIRKKPKMAKRIMNLWMLNERKGERRNEGRRKGKERSGRGNTFVMEPMKFANMEYPHPKITGVKEGKMSHGIVEVDLQKGQVELKNRRRRSVGLHDVAFYSDAKGNVVPENRRSGVERRINPDKKKRKR